MEKTTEKQRKTAINFKIYMKTKMKTYPPPPKKSFRCEQTPGTKLVG